MMKKQRNVSHSAWKNAVRVVIAVIAAGMIVWTLLPTAIFGIFNYGTVALLVVLVPVFLGAVFWPVVRQWGSRICRKCAGRWAMRAVAAVLALGVGYAAAVTGMMMEAAHTKDSSQNASVVIVLGCQTDGYNPSAMLASRLQKAREYLEQHPEAVTIVSGGLGETEGVSEAESMRAWLEQNGVNPDKIIMEDQSANTEENLLYSAQLMKKHDLGKSAVIVTDWWHELRGVRWAQREGLSVTAEPCATWPLLLPVFYVRELCGLTRLLFAGY